MFETMTIRRVYVEVNSKNHTSVCIQDIWKDYIDKRENKYCAVFVSIGGDYAKSDYFETEQEALDFRYKVINGGQE